MSKPFSFDFNDVGLPLAAENAANQVTREELVSFFSALEAANKLWSANPASQREAALASLRAVNGLIASRGSDAGGHFSRPLVLLAVELANAAPAQPGNILPLSSNRQAAERHRRQAVDYLKAASAFAAGQLSVRSGVATALRETAEVLREHRFPQSEFSGGVSSRATAAARIAKITALANKVKEWRKSCEAGDSKAATYYMQFKASRPCALSEGDEGMWRTHPIDWLKGELRRAGYDAR